MRRHDPEYIRELIDEWREGDANAFAAIYAVTCRKIYEHAYRRLSDIYLTQDAVTETYLRAGETEKPADIPMLRWLLEITDGVCDKILRYNGDAAEKRESASGQTGDVAEERESAPEQREDGEEKRKSGVEQTGDAAEMKESASVPAGDADKNRGAMAVLDDDTAEQMLYNILDTLGMEQNTVPLQNLDIYMGYRKQRSRLMILVVGIMAAIIILLPLLLIRPNMTMEKTSNADEAGRPVYTVHVSSILEIYSVTAEIGGDQMPVYQEGASVYTVRPTRNGSMKIMVTGENRRRVSTSVLVDTKDTKPPELVRRKTDGRDAVTLFLTDNSGIDYDRISGSDEKGRTIEPVSWEESTGAVTFAYPSEKIEVSIPDRTGNVLRLILNP